MPGSPTGNERKNGTSLPTQIVMENATRKRVEIH